MNYTRHSGCTSADELSQTSPKTPSRTPGPTESSTGRLRVTTVFLVDDHEVARRGLVNVLGADPHIRVVGEAGSIAEAMTRIPATVPDVAVLDVQLPDGSGIALCNDLCNLMPDLKCLMLSSAGSDQARLDALNAGAKGYLIKDIRGMELARAVNEVGAGRSLLGPDVADRLTANIKAASERADPFARLSNQERAVLQLLGQGLTNKEIAHDMGLAEKTVKNYVSKLFAKLGMERRIQAAVLVSNLKNLDPQAQTGQ